MNAPVAALLLICLLAAPARCLAQESADSADANLSQEEWDNVEVWVNRNYVVFLPKMEPNKLKTLNFQMLFDEKGNYFPLDNKKVLVDKVEVYRDGKMYDVPVRLGD